MHRIPVSRALAAAAIAGTALLPAFTARASAVSPSLTVLAGNVAQSDNAANPGTYIGITGAGFTLGGYVCVRVLDANGMALFASSSGHR